MKITLSKKKSFTLIELLVVIAIIGILSGVVLVSLGTARNRAKIARAKLEMEEIKKAMIMYRDTYGQLPPPGDNCSGCTDPCDSSWQNVMDAMVNAGIIQQGINRDPWGNFYCYDDNDGICCGYCSIVYSMGPNGKNESRGIMGNSSFCCNWVKMETISPVIQFNGDDFGFILPYSDRPCP